MKMLISTAWDVDWTQDERIAEAPNGRFQAVRYCREGIIKVRESVLFGLIAAPDIDSCQRTAVRAQ